MKQGTKATSKGVAWSRYTDGSKRERLTLLLVVIVFGFAGTGFLLSSHAATPAASIEAQSGSVSGGSAAKITDSSALSGKAVKFGAASGGGGTGTSSCPLPAYPNPSCTGVPGGTTFTSTINGDYEASTSGQFIIGWHITGNLIISGSNVVIKNSQIDGIVSNGDAPGSSFNIADSTIGPATGCHYDKSYYNNDLYGHDFTALRVYGRNDEDGVDLSGGNVSVSDSLFVQCFLPGSVVGGDGYHSDGVQDLCGSTCSNLTLTHDTFDSSATGGNSALNLDSSADGSFLQGVTLNSNMFLGGGYTTALRWGSGPDWTVINNHWVSGSWDYGPLDTVGTCSHQIWSGNSIVTINANYGIVSTVSSQACG